MLMKINQHAASASTLSTGSATAFMMSSLFQLCPTLPMTTPRNLMALKVLQIYRKAIVELKAVFEWKK